MTTSTFEVRVNGRAITDYHNDGKIWVEGRKGSVYTLYYKNNSSTRKKIVCSVDGLNIMTGDNEWKRGYVIEPWGSIDIPGWRQDNNSVASFEFGSLKESYNEQNYSGDKRNIGVIGCLTFDEKPQPKPAVEHHYHHYDNWWPRTYTLQAIPTWGGCYGGSSASGGETLNSLFDGHNIENSVSSSAAFGSATPTVNYMGLVGENATATMAKGILRQTQAVQLEQLCAEPQQGVGTMYGEEREFKTVEVDYEFKASASETLLIYYDTKDNLIQRGIIKPKKHRNDMPTAFPNYSDGVPRPVRKHW
jgi:hypothetical protein